MGRYREGIEAYSAALETARADGDRPQETETERLLSQLFTLLGDRVQALAHAERAATMAESVGLTLDMAGAFIQLAILEADAGNARGARVRLDRALAIGRQSALPVLEARAYNALGTAALRSGNGREAITAYEKELDARRRAKDSRNQAGTLAQLGVAHSARGDRRRALEYFRQALTMSHASGNPAVEAITLTSLMDYWRRQGQPGVAAVFGKQAINIFQQTRANLLQLDASLQRAYVDSRAQVYRDLADVLLTSGRLPEAQQVLDLLKAEEFRDFVRREGADPEADRRAELTTAEAAWESRYREIADRVAAIGRERGELLAIDARTPEEDRRLDQLESDLVAANEGFSQALNRLSVEFGRTSDASTRLNILKEAQGLMADLREIGPGTVVVYTLITPQRYHAMLITADARKATSIRIDPSVLSRRALALRQALQDPTVDPRGPAYDLYQMVMAPIARDLTQARARTVLWVLDGVLRYVPMAALYDGSRYVAESYRTVVITPASHSRLKDLPDVTWTGLGVGVSRPVAGFAELPAVSAELRGIFRESSSESGGVLTGQVLLDSAFTSDAFRASLRARPPIVHVASHFRLHPGDDSDSFLLLGDGGRMTMAELRRAPNVFEGVDLLTLSACNTAVESTDANGSEVESFGVLAQRQGAKAIVAGLWPVADRSTQAFMQALYRARVQGGVDKAGALQEAQLSLLRGTDSGGRVGPPAGAASARGLQAAQKSGLPPFSPPPNAPWAHPYYWAPFILIGNSR